jgi:hypothetical protein
MTTSHFPNVQRSASHTAISKPFSIVSRESDSAAVAEAAAVGMPVETMFCSDVAEVATGGGEKGLEAII